MPGSGLVRRISCGLPALLVWAAAASSGAAAEAAGELAVSIVYVAREEGARLPPLSLVEPRELPDEGLAGATLAIKDNQTTGGFLGRDYELSELIVPQDGDVTAAVRERLVAGERFFVADLSAEDLLTIADLPEAEDALIFNGRAQDDVLRTDECRPNVFHTIPSRAMKTDALAQFVVWKRWDRWFLIEGERPADQAFAAALRRSADKFKGKIVEERTYAYQPTSRVTETGHVQVQRQMPVFTQDAPEYDVLLVADESDVFGEYLPYQTWDPHPVAGTQGLVPTAWSRVHEQWAGPRCKTASRSTLDVGCASATTPHGSACARWARR